MATKLLITGSTGDLGGHIRGHRPERGRTVGTMSRRAAARE